ncbi:MAG: DUF424 family protein [Candidatus Woesearchaeota archaeon]
MNFITKIHKAQGKIVLAVCDEEIFGKKFCEGNKQIDLTSDFYNGKKTDELHVLELMKSANSINLVGKNIIKLAIKNNFLSEENVLIIDKIPIAIIVNEI